MENLFILASRNQFRFATPQGNCSVEDLWTLPLSSTKANQANLDDIAIALDKKVNEAGSTTSFVKKTTKANTEAKAMFDIVLYVIETKQAEATAAAEAQTKLDQKKRIMELLAQKRDESLANKSEEELQELLKNF